MANMETCPECENELDARGRCPACDNNVGGKTRQRPRASRDGSNGAPDMSNVVRFDGPGNRAVIKLPDNFALAPNPEEDDRIATAPDPVLHQAIQDVEQQARQTAVAEERREVMTTQPENPTTTAPRGALARLKSLAQETRANRVARLAQGMELPAIIIILADELFPEYEDGDAATRQRLDQELQEVKNENAKVVPFLQMYRALPKGDSRLRADYEKIVGLARKMDEAYQAREQDKPLTSEQSDLLREVDLEKMSTEALRAYNARVAEATKAEAQAREEQETAKRLAASQARQKNQQELDSMATHESIVDALEALQRGEKPRVVLHLGRNAPIPLEQYRDGRWKKEPLGRGTATIVFELWPPAEDEGKYTAHIIAESENARGVRFVELSDPEIGKPGVFAFDRDFSSLQDKRTDPFDCCRFGFRGWIHGDKIRREERDLIQGYRDGTTPNASGRDFIVNGSEGTLYVYSTFTIGRQSEDESELEFEGILTRGEANGPVEVVSQRLQALTEYGETPSLDALKGVPVTVSVFTEPMIQRGKPTINSDGTPRMRTVVSCEPSGLRKAIVDTPTDQKNRLVKLLESQHQITTERKNLHEFVENADPTTLGKVARLALERNTVPENRIEQLGAMVRAMYPCSILGRALWAAFRDEILNDTTDRAVPETAQVAEAAPNEAAPTSSAATEATPVASVAQPVAPPEKEGAANPVATV